MSTNSIQDLERLTEAVEKAGVDIAPNYDEYISMAFGIATDCGETGRDCFLRLCRLHPDEDIAGANRVYDGALAKGRGTVHIGTVFYLAQRAGVDVHALYDRWKEEREGRERVPADGNVCSHAVLPADDGVDDTDGTDPSTPLPTFARHDWPSPLPAVLAIAQRDSQADALLLGAFTVIGATLGRHLRFLYGKKWFYPSLQTFIVAPAASGKGMLAFLRAFGQQRHNALREQYDREMKKYMAAVRASRGGEDGEAADLPQRPLNRMFFISGNNTGTGILQNIIDSDGEGIIFEPEADTVSSAIKGDYGHWSDTLRKAFDHDTLSFNRRTNGEYKETAGTCLAVLLSGTPQQVKKLIPSAENGLFSRQLFYYMPSVQHWVSQFDAATTDTDELFNRMGENWGYSLDPLRASTFTLALNDGQKAALNELFDALFRKTGATAGTELNSFIIRLAINILRITSVTALLRALEGRTPLLPDNGDLFPTPVSAVRLAPGNYVVTVADTDFHATLRLAEPLAAHATHILSLLPQPVVQRRDFSEKSLLLNDMPHVFTRKLFLDKGRGRGMSVSSLSTWLQILVKKGIIDKTPNWGEYIKKDMYASSQTQGKAQEPQRQPAHNDPLCRADEHAGAHGAYDSTSPGIPAPQHDDDCPF